MNFSSYVLAGALLASGSTAFASADDAVACTEARQAGHHSAQSICKDEWEQANRSGDSKGAAEASFQLAILSRRQGEFLQAEVHLNKITLLPGLEDDWLTQYRLAREQGILAHVTRDPARALRLFRSALTKARANDDDERVARSLNDLGNAYRHIGASRQALDNFVQSLALKRASDDRQLGTTLNNIADLFVELDDFDQAMSFFRQALDLHQQHGDQHHIAHTLESLADLFMRQNRLDEANRLASQSLADFQAMDAVPDQVRLRTLLGRIAWMQSQHDEAELHLERAQELTDASEVALPPSWFNTQAARLDAMGLEVDALVLLTQVEPNTASWPIADRLDMLTRLSELNERVGNLAQALEWQQTLNEETQAANKAQRNQDLNRQRVLLELAEHQRQIEQLENEGALQEIALEAQKARTAAVGLAGLLGVVIVLLGAGALQRRRARAERANQARIRTTLNHYKRAAESLRTSQTRLQQLLNASSQAMLSLDANDQILMANTAACQMLGTDKVPAGQTLDSLFRQPVHEKLRSNPYGQLAITTYGHRLILDLESLNLEEEVQIVMLRAHDRDESETRDLVPLINRHFSRMQTFGGLLRAALKKGTMPDDLRRSWQTIDNELQLLSEQLQPLQDDVRSHFRKHLVDLMVESLAVWEKCTGLNRIELAEKSRIWRVTIDEGRLRTRAMDRYLNQAKLPQQPRWREVVRTAYFVLGECPEEGSPRLEYLVEMVQQDAQRLGQS